MPLYDGRGRTSIQKIGVMKSKAVSRPGQIPLSCQAAIRPIQDLVIQPHLGFLREISV
jgi:hypothetical protein